MKIEKTGKIVHVGEGEIWIDFDPDNEDSEGVFFKATIEEQRAASAHLYEDVTITIEIPDK